MWCAYPVPVRSPFAGVAGGGYTIEVPCGHCMACKIMRAREWHLRLLHELHASGLRNCVFITLTYADEYLPTSGTLVKKDFQDFLKRLRKRLCVSGLKYYACGEYGGQTLRPHYHAILFVESLSQETLEGLWSQGFVSVKLTDSGSFRYVTGYIEKKRFGARIDDYYKGRLPEFSLMSKGIGKEYILAHPEEIERGWCRLGKSKMPIPRYYLKLYKDVGRLSVHRYLEALKRQQELWESGDWMTRHDPDAVFAREETLRARLAMRAEKV